MPPSGDWGTDLAFGLFSLAFGYLLGSIPFGLILTHLAGTGDIRKIGSGNIGATNVLRSGHKALAALTLLFDMHVDAEELQDFCGFYTTLGHSKSTETLHRVEQDCSNACQAPDTPQESTEESRSKLR